MGDVRYLLEMFTPRACAVQLELERSLSTEALHALASTGVFTRLRVFHLPDHRVLSDLGGDCMAGESREILKAILAAEAVRS